MANPWLRLYSDMITNSKVLILPEALRWRYVALLCLHCNDSYKNTPDDEIALSLRITEEDWLNTKMILVERKLLNSDGSIRGWENRQFISDIKDPTAADRQKRYRDKKRNNSNVAVTSRPPESDTDTDTDGKPPLSKEENIEGVPPSSVTEETVPPAAPPGSDSNGTRLQKDWSLPKKWGLWALENFTVLTDEAVRREAEKFADYWHGKAGKDARKADWEATWRNWIRRNYEGQAGTTGKPWFLSSKGIEDEGVKRGIDRAKYQNFPAFKAAVYQAASVTDDVLRQARIDFPN